MPQTNQQPASLSLAASRRLRDNVGLWITSSLAVSALIYAVGAFAHRLSSGWTWPLVQFQSLVETATACIGAAVASLLLILSKAGRGTSCNASLAFGLFAMSFLNVCHALALDSQFSSWLHSVATFAAGLLLAQVFFPVRQAQLSRRLAWFHVPVMLLLGCSALATSSVVPQMIEHGVLIVTVMSLNIVGGILMVGSAAKLTLSFSRTANDEHLFFAVQCLLFGIAAIMYAWSQLWNFTSLPYLLHLMGFGVACGFGIQTFLGIQDELLGDNGKRNLEVTDSHQQGSELSRRFATLETAIDNHAICSITDRHGKILDVNAGFCSVTGYSPEEVIGQTYKFINSGHHSEEFWQEMWDTISSGKTWHGEVCNRAKDGSFYWANSTVIPVLDENGEIDKYMSLRFDISKQKAAEQAMMQVLGDLEHQTAYAETMAAEAELANVSKSEFLANMSHEIRTPMTAILGYAELLLNDRSMRDDIDSRDEAIRTIQRNGEHLLAIINDILDMSKIESGKLEVEVIDTQPHSVVEDVIQLLAARAKGKGIKLCCKYDTPIPETIQSDPTRLRQVLLNLVGNAIKFTEVGKVEIQVAFDAEENLVQFKVVDTGVGMSKKQLTVIRRFDAFSQADTSTTRKFGGTGLGLRISNSLAKKLGGSLKIESTQGVGSTFIVRVGCGDVTDVTMLTPDEANSNRESTSTQGLPEEQQEAPLEGLRILLAEDGPDNQRLISFLLRKAGAEVTVVENGRLAVDVLLSGGNNNFDVVLMDMQMPEMDGYAATRHLRKEEYTGPIIALTANAMSHDRDKCLTAGCDDFATKPINRSTLLATICEHAPQQDRSLNQEPVETSN